MLINIAVRSVVITLTYHSKGLSSHHWVGTRSSQANSTSKVKDTTPSSPCYNPHSASRLG